MSTSTKTFASQADLDEKQVAVNATHDVAPATNPLSYRKLSPIHGPRFQG